MGDNKSLTGIQDIGIVKGNTYTSVRFLSLTHKGMPLVEIENEAKHFTFDIGVQTKNKETTRKSGKWAYVHEEYLKKNNINGGVGKLYIWGKWKGGKNETEVQKYGIGGDYANIQNIIITPVSALNLLGQYYWMEAFCYQPGFKSPQGFFFVYLGKPQILDAYFIHLNENPDRESDPIKRNINVYRYGETIDIYFITHLLPDKRVHNSLFKFKIEIYCDEKKIDEEIKEVVINSLTDYNSSIFHNIKIKPKWRDYTEHKKDLKEYKAVIVPQEGAPFKVEKNSFFVEYKKYDDLLKDREVSTSQMIVKIQNTNPIKVKGKEDCKFTKIEITEEEVKPITVFDENEIDKGCQAYFLIRGDKKKNLSIDLKELVVQDFQSDRKGKPKCINQPEKHNTTINVFKIDKNTLIAQWLDSGDIVVKKNISEVALKYLYNYSFELGIIIDLAADRFWPFRYFWPNEGHVQTYYIEVGTCRYPRLVIPLKVYPDIKWEFKFEYNCKNPVLYRDTWVKMRQARVSDAVDRAQASDIDGYDGELEMQFKFGLGAEWNNGIDKKDFSIEWERKIAKFIGVFIKVKSIVNQLIGGKSGNALEKALPKWVKRQPVMIEIFSPGFSVGLAWELIKKKKQERNIVVTDLEVKLVFSPLIGGKGVLDLIAVASYIGPIGAIVRAVDNALGILQIQPTFTITAIGEIGAEASFKADYSTAFGLDLYEGYNVNVNGKFGFEVELSAKGQWKVKTWVFSIDGEIEAKAQAMSYLLPNLGFGADSIGGYLEAKVDFSGIKIVLEFSAKLNNMGSKRSTDIVIMEKKDDILGGKYYFNGGEK